MKRPKSPWFWLAVFIAVTAVLLVWLNSIFPNALASRDAQVDVTRSLLILGLVAASLFMHRRIGLNGFLRNLALWTAIGGVIFLGYSFRDEARWLGNRLMSELVPSAGQEAEDSIRFPVSAGGHFRVAVTVDGTPVRFLVDTGATDIVLSPADAERLGFDVAALSYSKIYNTANGRVYGAPVELGQMELGPIRLERVRASVNSAAMGTSLLGMSFLNRLSRYEVSGNYLVLYP